MQQRTLSTIMFTCLAFLALLPAHMSLAATGATIAKVIAITPGVVLERQGQTHNVALKDSLFVHDVIRTNATGKVQLFFNDDSVVTIGVNSIFSISDYSHSQRKSFKSHLNQGFARFVTGVIVKNNPEAFTVRTPQATAGIRGTTLAVQVFGQQTIISTENSTLQQSVAVGSTIINAGFRAIFGPNGTLISGPSPMTDAQRQEILHQARIAINNPLTTPQEDLKHDLELPANTTLDAENTNTGNSNLDMNIKDDLNTNLGSGLDDDLDDDIDNNLGNNLDDDLGDDLDNNLGDDLDDDFDDMKDGLDDDDLNSNLLDDTLRQVDLNASVSGTFNFEGTGGNDSNGTFSFEADLKNGAISGASLTTTDISGGDFTVLGGTGQINSDSFIVKDGTATFDGTPVTSWEMEGDDGIKATTKKVDGDLDINLGGGTNYEGEFAGTVTPK